jgi:hypothetical protein
MSFIIDKVNEDDWLQAEAETLIKAISKTLEEKMIGKRRIMYSDVINYIIRQDCRGEIYNKIIIKCNSNIRKGNYIIE